MQHKPFRILTALLAMSLLCVPAAAGDLQTAWDQPCQLTGTEFITLDAQPVSGIYITAVPASADGSFRYGSRVLCAGDVLPTAALSAITLEPNAKQDMELTMHYQPISGGSLGQTAALTVAVEDGEYPAPTAKDSELETYKNVANNGKLAFTASAEGPVTFTVTRAPKRGTVTINDDGTFLYTPNKNKVGSDKFTYTVTDAAGNTSDEATVEIEIKKPVDAAVYADLEGDVDQFEAMWMASTGLYAGKELAGQPCFEPSQSLTRGEFLVMLMDLAQIKPQADTAPSGFADAASLPQWLADYVAEAERCGIVHGISSEEGLVFRAEDPITCAQAAVMVQNLLRLPQPETAAVFADASVPVWAQDSVLALQEADLGIACTGYDQTLTRRQAAGLLYSLRKEF